MELPDDILLRSPEEASRRIALVLLEQARGAAERWLDPAQTNALHDLRVAIRRLACSLRAWDVELDGAVRKKHRRALHTIQKATGAGRDAEVGLQWLAEQAEDLDASQRVGLTWIERRLEQRLLKSKARMREKTRAAFDDIERVLRPRLELLRVEVNLARPLASVRFGAALAARLREHLARFDECLDAVDSPANRDEAHRARIRLKRLRYLGEPALGQVEGVQELIDDCKVLQDLFGDLNDSHVLGAQLDAALDDKQEASDETKGAPARAGLLELVLRAEAQRESIFVELEKRWLGVHRAKFAAQVESVATALEAAARANIEIERKYLLTGRPAMPPGGETLEVEQGWLPGKVLRDRVRSVRVGARTRYYRALKLGRGLTRSELEEETTKKIFDVLWPLTAGCRVRKRRTKIAEGALVWEIDEFTDRELWLAEVELPRETAVATVPAWLAPFIAREVTDERGFTNLELAGP